ncbi:MAG: hypothetical protein IPG99_05955 [Ignavibacteria bacterium]|nr:hypothetical protein [Ignavibacteria bacterium]
MPLQNDGTAGYESKLEQKLEEILKELKEMSEKQQKLKEKTDDTESGNKEEFEKNKRSKVIFKVISLKRLMI